MRTEGPLGAGDICHLAWELAIEHGDAALIYARRASAEFASIGADDRAAFWHTLSVFIDDIMRQRLDPETPIVFH
jgi:hypothetical protein